MGENMRDRVRDRAQQAGAASPGTDIATQAKPPATIVDHIRSMEGQFQLAMPRGVEAAQLVRDAITALRTTKKLNECDAPSVLGSLMTCAQLGLRPGVLGQAWILPYWDSKGGPEGRGGHKAQLIVGYKGLVALAYRSPQVKTVIGRMVRQGEIFEVDYGIADTLVHKPNMDGSAPGDIVAYYVLVKTTAGGHVFYVMTKAEAEQYKERYAPRNRNNEIVGPWRDNFDEMALKSCLRQLAKWMPQSTELQQAIDVDGTIGVDPTGATLDRPAGIHPDGPGVIDIDPGDITEHAEPSGAQA